MTAILRSDLSSSMCRLQAHRYKCFDSEIEGTSAEILSSEAQPRFGGVRTHFCGSLLDNEVEMHA
jgi:hypothetical protein